MAGKISVKAGPHFRLPKLRWWAGSQLCSVQQASHTGNLATMQRRLLSSVDTRFEVVLQQYNGAADCMRTVVVHLDNHAQQHELEELQSQVVCYTCSPSFSKAVSVPTPVTPCPATAQVCRMLRLSSSEQQKVLSFQKLHSVARAEGFGRLFRSPTVWEDLIKSILLCNCG